VRVRYGGGDPYPDLTSRPILEDTELEQVLAYAEPIGNVAVSESGRIFFTVHPESRPEGNKLLEWVSGAAMPYPSGAVQPHLFNTVLGLTVDRQNRLWSIDHGRQGFGEARLLAFDLGSGDLVHDYKFTKDIAPTGSFLQDIQVSADGLSVIIADGSILRKKPALVVYDVASKSARRILEAHDSVVAENYVIRNSGEDLSFFGGLFSLKGGANGLAIDAANEWLYFAAMSNSGLYRIRMEHVVNATLSPSDLQLTVERVSDKPLSDGMSADRAGNIYITDIEHGSISIVDTHKQLGTIIRSPDIRWASSTSFGPDGYLYVADSAFPELVLQTKEHIAMQGPFSIYRFKTGQEGVPGQ